MIDWDDAFDNAGYVPEAAALLAQWKTEAAEARARFDGVVEQSYGPSERMVFDRFSPEGPPKGTAIFVHGGYWHMLDKSYWSHFAAGWLGQGWDAVIPSYPLAPDARIAEITAAITRCVVHVAAQSDGPIALVGHSAGGHLVTRLVCKSVLPADVVARISRVVAVSGVHHLDPLIGTRMNDTLGLSEAEVLRESPVHLAPVTTVPITFWVGAHERPEFLRQNRMITERWALKGAPVQSVYAEAAHHFNVLDSLRDADGALTLHSLS